MTNSQCLTCGIVYASVDTHQCAPQQQVSGDLVALMQRLEYLARENERLKIRVDVLNAKKEMAQ